MKIKEAVKLGNRGEIEYILEKLLNKDKIFLHLNPDYEFDENQFLEILDLRKKEYPLEYIFNEAYFYGDRFYIKEGVLVPRDDTEPLIDIAMKELQKFDNPNIAEIGIGSGIISITLAKKIKAKFIATDINPIAIEVTKQNLKLHNVDIKLYLTNLLDDVDEKIDVIISNPPYVEEEWEFDALKYEPKEALFAKDNGTYLLKQIVKEGLKREVKLIICEMGYHQKEMMSDFFEKNGIKNFYFYKDLSGNDRGFVVKL
jgi:release factor glutamine methyltransferase